MFSRCSLLLSLVLLVEFASLSASAETVVVNDSFDSYANETALHAVWQPRTGNGSDPPAYPYDGILTTDNSLFPGIQGKAVDHIGNSILQHAGVGSIAPSATQNVVVQGDIFNAADNSSLRMTIGLRSNAGGGQNLVELGFHNHSTFNAFAHRLVLWGDDDFATVPNWADFALPAAFDTNSNGTNLFDIGPAWHRFRAVIGVDRVRLELDLYRNGMSMTLDGNGHPLAVPGPDSVVEYSITPTAAGFNSLRIGSPSGVVSTGGVAFDNLYLALVDVPTPGLPGDYNYDNRVDAADYVVWRKSLGTNILAGDGDGDGDVDANDYNVWRANFGKATLSAAAQAVVPEPTTAALAMLALLGLACRRNRARNQC